MENLRFRSAPIIANYNVPFALNEHALADWLHGLAVKQNYNSGKEMFCVLQAFAQMQFSPQQHLSFLHKISAYLDDLAEQLGKNYLDASFPLEFEEQTQVEIVTFAYTALAENYGLVGRRLLNEPNRLSDTALCLFLALEAAGKVLLHTSQVYMQPYEGFWLFCHQMYLLAEKNRLLNVEINTEDSQTKTIDAAFKHILMFDLADSSQFRPREMKAIYHFLKNFSALAKILHEYHQDSTGGLCRFNLNQDQPPKALTVPQHDKNEADRYISPVLAAKNLYQFLQQDASGHGATKTISRVLFVRVAKSLSMAQKRRHTRIGEQRVGIGLVGFNNVISFLYKKDFAEQNNLMSAPRRDTRIAGIWEVPDLDLVPEGCERMHQMETHYRKNLAQNSPISKILQLSREFSKDATVWKTVEIEKNKLVEDIPTGEFEIINSSAQGFRVSWRAADLKVKIGDIFAMPSLNGDRLEIGLIRRIGRHTKDTVQLGIEVLGFESELICLTRPGHQELECWAILLPGIQALKQADSVVFNSSDYSAGEFITMRRAQKEVECRLHKLLNATSAVNHVELLYP